MTLERTGEAERGFALALEVAGVSEVVDPFEDDAPIVAVCDLENPESCESCQ